MIVVWPENGVLQLLAALALLSLGCFDVQRVELDPAAAAEPDALVIDDFEDGDYWPLEAALAPWRCVTWNPGPGRQPVGCEAAPEGFDSEHGYALRFELSDTEDGVNDYPAAQLFAPTREGVSLDLTHFEQLRFAAKYLPGDLPLPEGLLSASFDCEGTLSYNLSTDNLVPLPSGWQRVILQLEDFAQPSWQAAKVDTGTCISAIIGLRFDISGLSDGQRANGTLLVDDVLLQ